MAILNFGVFLELMTSSMKPEVRLEVGDVSKMCLELDYISVFLISL